MPATTMTAIVRGDDATGATTAAMTTDHAGGVMMTTAMTTDHAGAAGRGGQSQQSGNGLAIASLILGFLSLCAEVA